MARGNGVGAGSKGEEIASRGAILALGLERHVKMPSRFVLIPLLYIRHRDPLRQPQFVHEQDRERISIE